MLVLDTNHFREIAFRTSLGLRLEERLDRAKEDAVLTIVTAEEVLRGWLARVAAARETSEQINSYRQLDECIGFLEEYTLLPWDAEAAQQFKTFRARGIRIGTLDLRIACIILEHDATLLTRNTVDVAKVPGLRFENWLD